MQKHLYSAILFGVLAVIAVVIHFFIDPSFGKGLLLGLGVALIVYIIRQFLPKREQ